LHADDSFDHAMRIAAAMRKRFLGAGEKRVVAASGQLVA
jgi:hypothetical protein